MTFWKVLPVRRNLLSLLAFLGWLMALSGTPLHAQAITPEDLNKLESVRKAIPRIEKEQEAQTENFAGLLELRDQLEPIRNDLRVVIGHLQERLKAAQAQLDEFGAPPAQGTPPESPQKASERGTRQAFVNQVDGHLRSARALQVQADQLWDDLTDARRDLFNSRIFQHTDSVLYPRFWTRLSSEGLPQLVKRSREVFVETREAIDEAQGWTTLSTLGAVVLLAIVGLLMLNRWLARRRMLAAQHHEGDLTKGAVIAHAGIELAMSAIPFVAMAAILVAAVARFEILPDQVESFLQGVAGAAAAYGIGIGAIRAVFSPNAGDYRVVRTDDRTARRAVRVLDLMLVVYLIGLVILGAVQTLSAPVALTIAITAALSMAVMLAGGLLLFREPVSEADAPASGLLQAPLHLLRPLFWILALGIAGSLLLGFIALAGLIVGRALATAVILCVAALVYIATETLFHDAIAPGTPANRGIAQTFGLRPETIDLVGTIVAGVFRVLIVAFTVLLVLSPWGVEFGNVNPFEDVLFGVRFGDLRGWIGAAGVALVLFTAGLACTRLFVSWLDGQLLPRTALNTGLRHSITTIAGYAGFVIALAIALGQAGVQLQNIALVAGALSVGIGFGLQQIVSNFVAGLIVLAERPIRVGDVIVVKGEEGRVAKISVRATELSLGENSTVIVPNADIISSIVKNRSFNDPTHRATVHFTVVHTSDLKAVFDILLSAARAHADVVKTPPPSAYIVKVTETGIEFDMHVVCNRIGNMSLVRSDLYSDILARFSAAGIRLAGGATTA